jgi:hypothetical protein
VVVMVVSGVMMVARLSECRGRNQHQEQGCEDNLFHGLRVAPSELLRKHHGCGECVGTNQKR